MNEDNMRRSENQSMRASRVGNRYFKVDQGYDKAVYENTVGNWFRIIGTFCLFYLAVALIWWACFSHGIRDIKSATWIYIVILICSFAFIAFIIIVGHFTNKKIEKTDKLTLEVNEEKKKRREEEEKKKKRDEMVKEMKKVEMQAMDEDDSETNQKGSKGDSGEDE